MRVVSSKEEREELLSRLKAAPQTPEIQSAIMIVEEAMEFADLREKIVQIFSTPGTPETFEKIVESKYVHHEMRPFAHAIDKIYENESLQRFKDFYGYNKPTKNGNLDKDGYITI